jgi:DNA-binding response OmpR family regulator
MSDPTVLIVDDNRSIRSTVANHLRDRGYEVIEAADGIEGLEKGLQSPSAIVLDVVMPGIDGFRLCQLLREREIKSPIIMLTEKQEIEDKVSGFGAGADDYLGKPFSPQELELRIHALLRRVSGDVRDGRIIKRGNLEIDLERYIVKVDGKEISLTPLEFNILKLLAATPGLVYSRQDILNRIWDTAYDGYKRNIDPHVNRLRAKLEENPKKPKYVLTVWGIGYKFNESL